MTMASQVLGWWIEHWVVAAPAVEEGVLDAVVDLLEEAAPPPGLTRRDLAARAPGDVPLHRPPQKSDTRG